MNKETGQCNEELNNNLTENHGTKKEERNRILSSQQNNKERLPEKNLIINKYAHRYHVEDGKRIVSI